MYSKEQNFWQRILIIIFLLKISLLILNKKSIKQLNTIRSILFKKTIVQLILLIATILKVTLLQKKSILKIEISSSSLFARNLIDNLIIN